MTKKENLFEYAKWVETMWISSGKSSSLAIASLGLAGETGEALEHIKKLLRDDKWDEASFKKEMGDVIYYWCKILNHFDIDPREVLAMNVEKIEDRKARKVQQGSGDER